MTTTRTRLLATTALGVWVGAASATGVALAADLTTAPSVVATPVTTRPAVDGINGAFALFGGGGDAGGLFGATGSLALPIGYSYGAQIDGTVTSLDGDLYLSVAKHLFWRDPAKGLVGLYGAYQYFDGAGGTNAGRVAAEGEAYLDRFTLRGVAGVEFGDKGRMVTETTITEFDLKTRFFDMIDLVYYPTDNFNLFVGHRYVGGNHALALGGEYMFGNTGSTAFSAFAEGRIGEEDSSVWAGVKVRFGNSPKSLIRRDREDDPRSWEPDTLFGIAGSLGTKPVTAGPVEG